MYLHGEDGQVWSLGMQRHGVLETDRKGLQSLGSVTTSSGPGSLRHTGAMGVDKDCEVDRPILLSAETTVS